MRVGDLIRLRDADLHPYGKYGLIIAVKQHVVFVLVKNRWTLQYAKDGFEEWCEQNYGLLRVIKRYGVGREGRRITKMQAGDIVVSVCSREAGALGEETRIAQLRAMALDVLGGCEQ